MYEGTRLGRQELDGEVLDDNPGALWKRGRIEELRVGRPGMPDKAPQMRRIVVAIDPAVSANENSDETGIVCVGLGIDGHVYVLEDASLEQATPDQWGKQAVAVYQRHKANVIVGEVNNGGDLVEANVRSAAKSLKTAVAFSQVRASRGKAVRAEPVSGLYEQGRAHHVGVLPKLEDQMCSWDPAYSTKSPDRMDALVWGVSEFLEQMNSEPAFYGAVTW
jgi:phage terminase large subunit-like protein